MTFYYKKWHYGQTFHKNTYFNQSQFAMRFPANNFVLPIEVRERAIQSFCILIIRGETIEERILLQEVR